MEKRHSFPSFRSPIILLHASEPQRSPQRLTSVVCQAEEASLHLLLRLPVSLFHATTSVFRSLGNTIPTAGSSHG